MIQIQKFPRKAVVKIVAWLFVVLSLTLLFYVSVSSRYSQVARYEDTIQFTDFAYYMKTVDQFWFTDNPTIYRMTTQSELFSDFLGRETDQIVLPHLSPIALLVWLPVAWLGKIDLAAAHALWMGVSFTLYVMSAQKAYTLLRANRVGARLVLVLLYCIAFLSCSTLLGITTGQSSFFACGLLLLVTLGICPRSGEAKQNWILIVGLVMLALKPHYYVWGLILVFSSDRSREALTSLGIVFVLLALLSIRLGIGWPLEYLQIMFIHSQPAPPTEQGIFYDVASMFNFRGTFGHIIGAQVAVKFSTIVYVLLTAIASIAGATRSLGIKRGWWSVRYVSTALLMNLLVGSYLLFSPLIFPYEDVLLVAMLVSTLVHKPRVFGFNVVTVAVLLGVLVQMNFLLFGQSDLKMAQWVIKVSLWIYMLYLNKPNQALDASTGGELPMPTAIQA